MGRRSAVRMLGLSRRILLLTALASLPARGQGPAITEFLADSDGSILDADGMESDWIEVQNRGSAPVDLLGWALTDDPRDLLKWRFPRAVLAPGAFLVVFASGKDRAVAGSELHTSFKLSAEGDLLALVEPDGVTIASRFAPYPPQRAGFSFGVGRRILEPSFVKAGSPARVLVPASGDLGLSFTGGAEPFDDSSWLAVTLGIGYPGSGGPVSPQPIAYYGLDGTAEDGSGGDHHGEVRGGASFSTDVPVALGGGKSLRLDGADDFVSAPLDVSEGPYSLSLWFKADAAGHGIFAVVAGDLGANGHDRHLYLNGGNIAGRVWSEETIVSSARNYADRRWHHAAHVFGGLTGGQRIYVDGLLVASGAKAASDFNWQERINIGFSNDAAAPFFAGLIDDVSLWDVALTSDQVRSLAAGAHPLSLSGYAPWIATDLETSLRGVSASAYVRVPFDVPPSLVFDSLTLRIRYDDGFVAYLNGVEVARRNSPAAPAFDARALSDRPASAAIRPEEIDLGAFRGTLRSGPNVLAFHLLNDRPDGADLLLDPELFATLDGPDRFLVPPTPGAANAPGIAGFVAEPLFSVERGFFKTAFDVEIATPTDGAAIYTTRDGSAPAPGNPAAVLYAEPVRITKTTFLRAAAFKDDHQPTKAVTQTYIFLSQVARQPDLPAGLPSSWAGYPADYGVDFDVVGRTLPGYGFEDALRSLPTLSLVTGPQDLFSAASGIYANSQGRGPTWERAASIELIEKDGSTGFQADCGIRLHGNSSRDHGFTPKHPIRLYFRSRYGQKKLKHDLFEDSKVSSFDELLLRGCSTDSWPVVDGNFVLGVQRWAAVHATYMRDQWMRDAQIEMGRPSCSGTYVHLYLNGLYWGLYNLAERPVESFCASHLGGEEEEYDILKDFGELEAGNTDAWNAAVNLAAAGLGSDAAYQRIQGRNTNGTRNAGYPVYLDVENLIDYMILHIASGSEDWPNHNWWGARRRGPASTGFKFFAWDQEISNDSLVRTHTLFETPFEQPAPNPSPSWFSGQCTANASYRRAFGDRVQKLLFDGGLLAPEANSERWLRRQGEIDHAIVGESARWGDSKRAVPYKREVEWLREMDWMRDHYWPEIQPIAVERFRRVGLYPPVDAPWFEIGGERRHGGSIGAGELLSIAVQSGTSTISFTLDGKDPMDPMAMVYSSPFPLERTTAVKARARDGGEWSALVEAIFVDPREIPLRVSEVSYQPAPREGDLDPDEYEFLELVNAGSAPLDLAGVRIEGGVALDLGASGVGPLGPGERILLVEDRDAFAVRYGLEGMKIAGQYTGKLSNDGERLVLKGPRGEALLEFRYDPAWYPETRGGGRTLVIADEGAPPEAWSLAASWRPSAWEGGSPGEPEPDAGGGGLRLPGDSNGDASLDLSDVISLLFRLFVGGPADAPCLGPLGEGGNLALLDSSGDARVDITDAVHVLRHLFQDGPEPVLGTACMRIAGCPPACGP